MKHPLGVHIKKTYISKSVFSPVLATTCIIYQCTWPSVSDWLSSRLNGFVTQCYCHKKKKPGFNDLASPHEGRLQGSLQLGTVEVVFDQLLSAWLGVNRWTNYTHVRTVLRKTWLLIPLAYPKTNDLSASLKCVDQTKVLHQQPPGSYNGIKIRTLTHSNTQTHANVIITLKAMAIWRLRANTAFTLNTKQGITQNIATDGILAHYQQN